MDVLPACRLASDRVILPARVHACQWVDLGSLREASSELCDSGALLSAAGLVLDSSTYHSQSPVSHSPPHSGCREADLCGPLPPNSFVLQLGDQFTVGDWKAGGNIIWGVCLAPQYAKIQRSPGPCSCALTSVSCPSPRTLSSSTLFSPLAMYGVRVMWQLCAQY